MNADQPSRWYKSKVDWWIAALIALGPVVCAAATIAVLVAGGGGATMIPLIATVFIVLVYGGLVVPMRYGITRDAIIVRHGIVRQRIPLADITEVHPTRNPLSSPALSLDRLNIKFGQGYFKSAMISPDDKPSFLSELADKAGLVRDGEGLRRPAR